MDQKIAPKYRCQSSASGERAFDELGGHRYYLGKFGSTESKQEYHRLLAEWTANHQALPVPTEELTVVELVARFWEHVKDYYRRAIARACRKAGVTPWQPVGERVQ